MLYGVGFESHRRYNFFCILKYVRAIWSQKGSRSLSLISWWVLVIQLLQTFFIFVLFNFLTFLFLFELFLHLMTWFKFWWATTISRKRLIVSGALNLVRWWVSWTSDGRRTTGDHTHRLNLHSTARQSRRNCLIIIWCDTKYLACAELYGWMYCVKCHIQYSARNARL